MDKRRMTWDQMVETTYYRYVKQICEADINKIVAITRSGSYIIIE